MTIPILTTVPKPYPSDTVSPTAQPIIQLKELVPDCVRWARWKVSLCEKWPVGMRKPATERGMEGK